MTLHTIELTAKLSDAELAAVCGQAKTKDPRKAVAKVFKPCWKRLWLAFYARGE